jgi:processive 1,2-diacylglycerol beta-glucosyltransferase
MKKKIIIFTSAGGGGHTAATQALISYLGDKYEIIVLDMFLDVIKFIIIPQRYSFTDVYNDALKKGQIIFINTLKFIARGVFRAIRPLSVRLIVKAIKAHNADCLISLIPLTNDATLAAAEQLNIPFFLIPTDFDQRAYLYGIKNSTYEKFYIARVIDDPKIDSYLYSTGIKPDKVINTGFVIRADFFAPKDPAALKKKLHIPEKVPVILIMLGSTGSDNTYTIARELHKINIRCHVIFCTGRYTRIRRKIGTLKLPPHITTHVLGFTKDISDLMATADIFVTKPGPNSISEALQMNVPLIVATFGRTLSWEKFNITYVTKHSFGAVADTINELYRALKQLLESPRALNKIQERIQARKRVDLSKTIPEALDYILKNEK